MNTQEVVIRSPQSLLTGLRKRILKVVYPPSSGGGLQCTVTTTLISSPLKVTSSVLVSQHLGIKIQQLFEV